MSPQDISRLLNGLARWLRKNGISCKVDTPNNRVLFGLYGDDCAIEVTRRNGGYKYTFIRNGVEEFKTQFLASMKHYIVTKYRGLFDPRLKRTTFTQKSKTLTVHIPEFLYVKIRMLVDIGIFPNVSELVRVALWEFINKYKEYIPGEEA